MPDNEGTGGRSARGIRKQNNKLRPFEESCSETAVPKSEEINTCIGHQDWVHLFGVDIPTYRVFIRLIRPKPVIELGQGTALLQRLPFLDPFLPIEQSFAVHNTLTSPLAALLTSLSLLGRLRDAVLSSSRQIGKSQN